MLTDSPVVSSTGPRILFLVGAIVTAAILLWMHQMRLSGDLHGLTTIFFVLFAFGDYGATVCMLLILVLAVFIPVQAPARAIFRWAGENPVLIAVISLIVLCGGALGVYHNHPLSMDEYAAYFQSRVFAAGHLSGQFPLPQMDWLIPPGFQDFFLNVSHATGHVASSYWPAHALIMTPFTFVGIPWACNPVVSALTLLVIHRLALRIFQDTEAAGLALLLTAASPVFFGIGISYYSMPSHLLANCLYALLLIRPTPSRAFAAGIVGSIALTLHNPVPHMLFAAPWLVWIATRPGGIRLLVSLCAGYLPLCGLLGIGWFEFSNHLRAEGQQLLTAKADAADRFKDLLGVFSLPTATVLLSRLIALAKIWVWAVPGLLLLACSGAVRGRRNITCVLFAASALTTLIGYLFFPQDQGHGWGYRYFHSAWMALPLLATAAIYSPAVFRDTPVDSTTTHTGIFKDQATKSYVVVCILLTLVFGVGLRAWQMQAFMADDLAQLPHYRGSGRHIVFIDITLSFYGGDLVQNDPWLRGNEIRMFSHGVAEDKKMMSQYYPTWHRVFADHFGTVWSEAN
ncbi:MAG TPA: hypothetical protein VHW25_08655 [Steroidobacteraceae bacterium]|nr:hypothetical protein [Steroidobacteraceae bacterium]